MWHVTPFQLLGSRSHTTSLHQLRRVSSLTENIPIRYVKGDRTSNRTDDVLLTGHILYLALRTAEHYANPYLLVIPTCRLGGTP